jgi:DNA-binding transcriptional ArsR family regulator
VGAKTKKRKGAEQTLAKVVAHPLRIEALSIFVERPASPKELAAELGSPVSNVSYHVRELARIGMIELVEEKKRRGAIEHFYRAIWHPMLDAAEFEKLTPAERAVTSALIVQLMLADAVKALDAGTFDARGDRHLSRTEMLVDEPGWEELIAIQKKALRAVLAVQAKSAKRLAKTDEAEEINVVTALSCFELPPKRPQPNP